MLLFSQLQFTNFQTIGMAKAVVIRVATQILVRALQLSVSRRLHFQVVICFQIIWTVFILSSL